MHQPLAILEQFFGAHDIETAKREESLHFPRHPQYQACAHVSDQTQHSTAVVVRLDVEFEYAALRVIRESFAGKGASREAALQDAFQNFSVNTLHVLLASFFGQTQDSVTEETWQIAGREAKLYLGPAGIRGQVGQSPDYANWFPLVEKHLKNTELSSGVHWLRIFVAQLQNDVLDCEVLLDNHTNPELQVELARYPWPRREEYYSVRQFLIVHVSGEVSATPQVAVECLAELILDKQTFDEDEVLSGLVKSGVPAALAQRAYNFTQISWSRHFLSEMKVRFDDSYFIYDSRGGLIETGQLSQEPCYQYASKLAEYYRASPGYRHLVLTSADVNSVNALLNAGSKPEDCITMPIVQFAEPTPEDVIQRVMAEHVEKFRLPLVPAVKKPWWQFW
jgi:hypothetical protein